ncbi:MAG: DUF3160 domain-containing protein [Bacteroides sp.]|nr:DUF3160 domain-containing protein [Roseburia sp.]MCM1345532.1 DUF3160 domain-containing protein [Bacteroides sp.]MCM1420363.1 DUF3160 domain-containing protein [Bacteroides sp.]
MKNRIIIPVVSVLMMSSCLNTGKTQIDSAKPISNEAVKMLNEIGKPSFLLTDSMLPQHIDFNTDISRISYGELRLLRSYPYALHGFWFKEADINTFFCQRTDWYYNLCEEVVYKKYEEYAKNHHDDYGYGIVDDFIPYSEVELTKEEKDFVEKIDKRMREMERDSITVNELLNPNLCVNVFQIDEPDSQFVNLIADNNFAIIPTQCEQLFNIYEANDYAMMPSFITTDLYLQIAHTYFSYTLKSLERKAFCPALLSSIKAMYEKAMQIAENTDEKELKNCAEYAATFFAIAGKLMSDEVYEVPETYRQNFNEEIQKIMNCEDALSDYLGYKDVVFPYSLFKPRGHYTRNENETAYFRTMMWLQAASFCRENKYELQKAVFIAQIFNHIPSQEQKRCRNVYDAISFLMGEPDNLSIIEIADYMKAKGFAEISTATNDNVLSDINEMLVEAFKTRNKIAPKIQISCADKINFMPQRYMADNEILAAMTDVTIDAERAFPKGLDVFAALGVTTADSLLDNCYNESRSWNEYEKEASKIKSKFDTGLNWNATMYNKWIENLLSIQQENKNYPRFMQTPAWQCKNLNTALASWSKLKHDAVLYAEQPLAAECGDGGLTPPIVVGYIEPNLLFWTKLKEMVTLNRNMLQKADMLTTDLDDKTSVLEEKIDFCIKIIRKEMAGIQPTRTEYMDIQKMGSSIEWYTLSILDPDVTLDCWENIIGADRSIAVVSDVYTRNVTGCSKNGILHEGTGNADAIYVVVNIGGTFYITRGAVFSHYEFVRPLNERLTDEEWQKMIEENNIPIRHKWMQKFIIDKEPGLNEELFYSSGC